MRDSRPFVAIFQMVSTAHGGTQMVTANVMPRLLDRFRIALIDPYQQPDYAERLCREGVEIIDLGSAPVTPYIGGKGTGWRPWLVARRTPWMIARLLRLWHWTNRYRPDILFFNQLPVLRFFTRAVPKHGPALVFHAHGFRSAEEIGSRTARLMNRRFARVMPVSKITARWLIEAGVEERLIRMVYNALDIEALRRRAEHDGPPLPPRRPDDVVFVHVAAVTRHKKAQHIGVEAMGLLKDAPVQLWICGDVRPGGDVGYLEELKRRVAELGLQERVHFIGWRTDVPRVVRLADVSILPSIDHSESFGLVLVEAMALGKPCIGSTMGGVPEVIEDGVTGLVCEPRPETLAAAMRTLAGSAELRARMGEAGRRRVEEHFTLERQVRDIGDVLEECCRRQGATMPRSHEE